MYQGKYIYATLTQPIRGHRTHHIVTGKGYHVRLPIWCRDNQLLKHSCIWIGLLGSIVHACSTKKLTQNVQITFTSLKAAYKLHFKFFPGSAFPFSKNSRGVTHCKNKTHLLSNSSNATHELLKYKKFKHFLLAYKLTINGVWWPSARSLRPIPWSMLIIPAIPANLPKATIRLPFSSTIFS